ncbi:hypothetical protein [Streptomyces sp. NPDC005322]
MSDPSADDSDGFHNAGAITVVPGSARWPADSEARTHLHYVSARPSRPS